MGILIKGMDEIPEDGAVLVVKHDNGKAYIKHACTYGYSMELVKLPAVQSDHVADISKKVSISCAHENDVIFRQAAIDAAREELESGTYFDIPSKIGALPAVQPDHNADVSKKVSISCAHENDVIFRQAAIDALWKALYEYEDETEKQFLESEELDVGEWIGHRIFVQNMNDIDRQTILNLPSAQPETNCSEIPNSSTDCISRRAAIDEIKAVYEWHNTVTVDRLIQHFKALPSAQPDLSGYSDKLWKNAYERGKAEAEADKDELLKILKMAKFEYEEAWRIITHPTPDVTYADKNRAQVILDTFRDSLGKIIDELSTVQPDHVADTGKKVCVDAISRQAAIDALAKQMPKTYTPDGSHPADEEIYKIQEIYVDCIESIEILPAVQPEHKRGEWIGHPIKGTDSLSIDKDTCSHCGERFYQIAETGVVWNFCPNCGADMRGGQDGAD